MTSLCFSTFWVKRAILLRKGEVRRRRDTEEGGRKGEKEVGKEGHRENIGIPLALPEFFFCPCGCHPQVKMLSFLMLFEVLRVIFIVSLLIS